ncbi:TraK family protein [Desulfovibrio sp. OttesenSCG-928-A18]|nr:TraK family protein [Desulfovibrio sp. OttesenSCG-928-A18]
MSDRPTVTAGRHSSARVEYYACREDVEALLTRGYSARMVYEHMKEQGRVTCSYSAFCDYVRGKGKRMHSSGKRKNRPVLKPVPWKPLGAPHGESKEPSRFEWTAIIDPKKLI